MCSDDSRSWFLLCHCCCGDDPRSLAPGQCRQIDERMNQVGSAQNNRMKCMCGSEAAWGAHTGTEAGSHDSVIVISYEAIPQQKQHHTTSYLLRNNVSPAPNKHQQITYLSRYAIQRTDYTRTRYSSGCQHRAEWQADIGSGGGGAAMMMTTMTVMLRAG